MAAAIALLRDSSDLNDPLGRPRPFGLVALPAAAARVASSTRRAVSMACCLRFSDLYEPGRRPRRFFTGLEGGL